VPPQLVASRDRDLGPALEPRCAFKDDVCCPGELPDCGVAEDLAPPPDLCGVDSL
jgi:hypothetical protein